MLHVSEIAQYTVLTMQHDRLPTAPLAQLSLQFSCAPMCESETRSRVAFVFRASLRRSITYFISAIHEHALRLARLAYFVLHSFTKKGQLEKLGIRIRRYALYGLHLVPRDK